MYGCHCVLESAHHQKVNEHGDYRNHLADANKNQEFHFGHARRPAV